MPIMGSTDNLEGKSVNSVVQRNIETIIERRKQKEA